MASNKQTVINKSNTLEQFRQKANDVSLHLGDNDQLASHLSDYVSGFTASANDVRYIITTGFEHKAEETLDNTAGYIILQDSPTLPASFVAGATITQDSGYSAEIVSVSDEKILVVQSSGSFTAAEDLDISSDSIPAANVVRLVSESYNVGSIRVYKNSTEALQNMTATGFHVAPLAGVVTLTSPGDVSEFTEGGTVYQGSSLGSSTFSGTILHCSSTQLLLKTVTGTFSASVQIKLDGSSDTIAGAAHGDITLKAQALSHVVEFNTPLSASDAIEVRATDIVKAINELQDDVGITENLTTGSSNLVDAINEHETDLYGTGNVSFSGLSSTGFQDAVEELRTELGNHNSLGTDITSNVVGAVNEIETAVRGSTANYTLNTTANDLVGAINEHEVDIGDMSLTTTASDLTDAISELHDSIGDAGLTTTATQIKEAVNELDAELGTITAGAMGTSASTVSGAIAEHDTQIGNVSITSIASGNNTITGALSQLHSELGSATLTTSASTHTGAINEHESDIGNMVLTGLSATNLSAGLRELASEKLDITNTSAGGQSLSGNINYTVASGNGTFDFGPGTTLDISDGTLLVSAAGGVANFGSAFLNLDGEVSAMGLQVDRDYITPSGTMTNHDVKVQWNESLVSTKPERAWQVVGMEDDGTTGTADIVTFYNAKDLIQSNAEAGISVDWDGTNQNFDFNVDDFTITLGTGPISGSVTVTNLANATFNTSLDNDSVALGTKTTGNYIATIAGTSNEIEVSGSGSETAAVTIGLPNDVTIGNNLVVTDYTRTAGLRVGTTGADPGDNNFAVNGNATIAGNTTITGNLTVNGTQTVLNTSTLEVEDTLVLAGNDLSSEPSSGGFGLEVGPITSPSGVASGVTGAHSIVYNYATDRWEADGSLILSSATLSTPQVEGVDFGPGDNLTFTAGSGLSESVSGYAVTYTNTDKGSSQNIFKNVASSSGTAVADNNNDTLTIVGGNDLSTSVSGDILTIQHDNSGASAGSYGARHTVPNITVDARGHVTSISNNSAITLGSLGYSGSASADNYGSFNIRANTAASTAIGSGETITFTDSGATTVTRSGNTIDISSVNTQYSVGDGGLTAVNFTTARRDKLDGIATSANNYSWQYDTSGNGSNQTVSNGNVIRIQGSGATSVTHSGSTITISSTDTNTDTNTITNIGVNNANYTNGNINFQASGAASISKSGNTVTISSTNTTYSVGNGGLTEINFTSALNSKLAGIAAGATNVTNNNQLTNGAGYTTYSSNQATNNNSNVHFEGLMVGQTSGSTANTIRCTGDVVAFYSSDERLKDNITPIKNSLEKVGQLKGYEFDWNDKQEVYEGHDVGVIAQEVEKVVPEIVETRKHDGYKAVKYEKLVPLLINAINELKAEIEELKVINKGIEK